MLICCIASGWGRWPIGIRRPCQGEQQRIAVARALAHRPKLLLADEPTGNLDEATGESVIALLGELARDQQASLLVVTHSDRVARVADRVLRLDRGQLLAA